jgi:hypothetical protein
MNEWISKPTHTENFVRHREPVTIKNQQVSNTNRKVRDYRWLILEYQIFRWCDDESVQTYELQLDYRKYFQWQAVATADLLQLIGMIMMMIVVCVSEFLRSFTA